MNHNITCLPTEFLPFPKLLRQGSSHPEVSPTPLEAVRSQLPFRCHLFLQCKEGSWRWLLAQSHQRKCCFKGLPPLPSGLPGACATQRDSDSLSFRQVSICFRNTLRMIPQSAQAVFCLSYRAGHWRPGLATYKELGSCA